MKPNQIIQGDIRIVAPQLPDQSANCIVTSPPYWGLRDYGHNDQIGLESTPEEYVQTMVGIFRELRRVLRDDGTLWLNLGDSYFGSWGNYGDAGGGQRDKQTERFDRRAYADKTEWRPPTSFPHGTLKPKDLVGIPWRVALALQADGWYLRSDIIWSKPNCMPESVTDRPTKAHEYLFLLSKNESYYYDQEAIKEPVAKSTIGRGPVDFGGAKGRNYNPDPTDPNYRNGKEQWGRTFDYTVSCTNGRNKRTVWTISTKPYSGAHFAVFPPDLIEPCILAGCPPGGVVLDPFFGSGTVGQVCIETGRNWLGVEINPEYIKLAEQRISGTQLPLIVPSGGVPANKKLYPNCYPSAPSQLSLIDGSETD